MVWSHKTKATRTFINVVIWRKKYIYLSLLVLTETELTSVEIPIVFPHIRNQAPILALNSHLYIRPRIKILLYRKYWVNTSSYSLLVCIVWKYIFSSKYYLYLHTQFIIINYLLCTRTVYLVIPISDRQTSLVLQVLLHYVPNIIVVVPI